MDNFQKYSRLMLLIIGSFIGLILLIALFFFVFRLFSITVFYIPGFDLFFQYTITAIPYLLFFAAYYYLSNKIKLSKSKVARIIARSLLLVGCGIGLFTLFLSTAIFFHVKSEALRQSIKAVIENELETMGERLNELEAKERIEMTLKLMSYVMPKVETIESTYDLLGSEW
jgi:membrane protease YdiL (CAAX protease family)